MFILSMCLCLLVLLVLFRHYDYEIYLIHKSDGSLDYKQSYEYKFDARKNWIKQITFIDAKPVAISNQEFEYFKN